MRKIEKHQDTVNHGVPKGDQGIEAAPLQGIHQVLHKKAESHSTRSLR
jgi:hypothetical protein